LGTGRQTGSNHRSINSDVAKQFRVWKRSAMGRRWATWTCARSATPRCLRATYPAAGHTA